MNRNNQKMERIELASEKTDEVLIGVTVRIPKKMYWQLTELAAADTRPTANLIRKVLDDYLKANYKPRGEIGPDGKMRE